MGPPPRPAVPEHPSIYLLSARPWLFELGADGLSAVTDAQLSEVAGGVDIVWLQGAWEVGAYGRLHDLRDPSRRQHFEECLPGDFAEDDCIGSPYAISQYKLNPELGSDEDLAAFRERLAKCGTALMLDFVPNHMARDSPWVEQPGMFITVNGKPAFGRDPYSGDWTDTAQLNYWSPVCRERMLQELLEVAGRCDGVRVDMAMLCTNAVIERTWGSTLRPQGFQPPDDEFWQWALGRVRERFPRFLVMAECYEYDEIFPRGTGAELLRQGFHAVYDKVLYDRLRDGHMDNLRGHLFGTQAIREGRMCHFTENHDEDRAAAHFGGRGLAAAVVALTLPGPRMLMWGQDRGFHGRLAVQLRRCRREAPDESASAFYGLLLEALPFCRGTWKRCDINGDSSWRLIAWGWRQQESSVVVAVNYTDAEAWGHVDVGEILAERADSSGIVRLRDLLSGESYERSRAELQGPTGLVVGLRPFAYHLLLCG